MMATRSDVPHTPDQMKELWDKLVSEAPKTAFDDSRKSQTLLQILENEPEASIFLERLKRCPSLFEALKSTETEHTVFVPVNNGWPGLKGRVPIGNLNGGWSPVDERAIKDPQGVQSIQESSAKKDPSIEEATIAMHVSPHYLSVEDLMSMPNVPTMRQCLVSNRRPILNINAGASGYTTNGIPIVKSNIKASNGIIHFITVPFYLPLPLEEILGRRQDTKLAAHAFQSIYPKLTSGRYDQAVFVPSDQAIKDLGDEVVEFLFETESGRQYLIAILKYHVNPHTTVYSNFIWPKNDTGEAVRSSDPRRTIKGIARHSLASALVDKQGVAKETNMKFVRFGGLVSTFVNEYAHVTVPSIAGINGSINVIDRVLIPGFDGSTEISVQKIKDLLADYV